MSWSTGSSSGFGHFTVNGARGASPTNGMTTQVSGFVLMATKTGNSTCMDSCSDAVRVSTTWQSTRANANIIGRWVVVPTITRRFLNRSEEHTSELQSLMRISYAVFCLKNKTKTNNTTRHNTQSQNTQH